MTINIKSLLVGINSCHLNLKKLRIKQCQQVFLTDPNTKYPVGGAVCPICHKEELYDGLHPAELHICGKEIHVANVVEVKNA